MARFLFHFCCVFSASLLSQRTTTLAWSRVTFTRAPKVSGHSVGSVLHKNDSDGNDASIILFGGLTGPAGSPCTDETWEFSGKKWTLLETKEKKPRVRMYAASAVLDNKLFLFGGWDPGAPGSGGDFLDDIWKFDLDTKEWSQLDAKLPYPVSRHTACTLGGGAASNIVLHTYKGILIFNKDGTLMEQETLGDSPEGLSMCAVAPLNDAQMLLFGGSTRTQELSQETFVLDTHTWTWTKLSCEDTEIRPPSLASACAAHVDKNKVVLFGGATIGSTGYEGGMGLIPKDDTWLLEVADEKSTWKKLEFGENPNGRVAASLLPITSSPPSFLLQGGYDPVTKTTFDEPWILSI